MTSPQCIPVDHHDLDSVEEAKGEIARQIESLEKPDAKIETPISVAVELQSLRQSDNPEHRSLADLLAAVTDLRSAVAGIEKRLVEPEMLLHRFMRSEARMDELHHYLANVVHNLEHNLEDFVAARMPSSRAEPEIEPPPRRPLKDERRQ